MLQRHKAIPALFFHLFRHLIRQIVGGGTFNRAVLKAAHAIQPCLFQEIEQHLEIVFGFAREADDKRRAQGQLRANLTPLLNTRQLAVYRTRTLHQLQNPRAGVLQRNIQIRQDFAFRHQRDHIVHVRVRVDVMQTHPDAKLRELFAQAHHAGFDRGAVPEAGAVFHVHAVSGGVLRNHQQLFDARFHQTFRLGQHVANRAAVEIAAHRRDNAEGAAMVAAFGNFQVGVVARRQLHTLFRHKAQKRVVLRLRHIVMNMLQHLLVAVRPGDLQHFRVHFADLIFFRAETAGDNHLAVFIQRLADRLQRLLHRAVDKPAGVDDNHIGVVIAWHHVITFGAKLSQDAFRVHQVFWAAQRNEADLWLLHYIAHRSKIHHLWSYQGGDFTEVGGKFVLVSCACAMLKIL